MKPQQLCMLMVFFAVLWTGCAGDSKGLQGIQIEGPQGQSEVVSGENLYNRNCATCHGVSGSGMTPMFQGKRVDFTDATWQKLHTLDQIKQTIRSGKGVMPAFETTFSDDELNRLAQYVKSLGA